MRLDERIDEMIRDGLLTELDDFYAQYKAQHPLVLSDERLKGFFFAKIIQLLAEFR